MLTESSLPLVAVPVGFALCAFLTGVMRRVAVARDFVDRPGGHKGHDKPVALGGGVAVTASFVLPMGAGLLACALLGPDSSLVPNALAPHLPGIRAKAATALGVCAAAVVMCALGLADDRRPLSAMFRFGVQILLAAFLVIVLKLRLLSHLGPAISISLSMLWILTLTNSMNFLDNMDGLAGGVAAIAAAIFGVTATLTGQVFVPVCCWLLAGALVGFLVYNFHPASIYMGDAGSTVVGMLLAVFTILTTFASPAQGQKPIGVIAPLVVMAVPLYDTASVFYLRWRIGVPIWTGDRRHFSHRLVRRGMSVRKAVLVIWLATLVTALPALILPHADWPTAVGVVAQTALVVILVALLESSGSHDET